MSIVYLAWGSLTWNWEGLKLSSPWVKADLDLPLEFSRISEGGNRLTLVIDDKNGEDNQVSFAYSKSKDLTKAIKNLRIRERTVVQNIAYLNIKKRKFRFKNTPPHIFKRIMRWANTNGINSVIWTDLPSNWQEIRGVPYSVEDAMAYFHEQPLEVRMKIIVYIYGAIVEAGINTPFSRQFIRDTRHFIKNTKNNVVLNV